MTVSTRFARLCWQNVIFYEEETSSVKLLFSTHSDLEKLHVTLQYYQIQRCSIQLEILSELVKLPIKKYLAKHGFSFTKNRVFETEAKAFRFDVFSRSPTARLYSKSKFKTLYSAEADLPLPSS
jgi:hypothetical protein